MAYERVDELRQSNPEIEDKLSFGSYIGKQLRTIGIQLVTTGAGIGVALGIGKLTGKTRFSLGKYGENFGGGDHSVGWIGGIIGATLGAYFTTYEHWAKNEATNLSVAEINKDIAEAHLRLDPELKRENLALRDLVKQQANELKKRGTQRAAAAEPEQLQQAPTPEISAETVHTERLKPHHEHAHAV